MKVLHAYNLHRSGGGASVATLQLVDLLRERGVEVQTFERTSTQLQANLQGRIKAATSAFVPGKSVRQFSAALDAFKPHLVHAHELFPLVSPWILPECKRRGIPVVMTCNDYHLTCPARNHIRAGAICTLCADGTVYRSVLHNCRGNLPESMAMAAYCSVVNGFGLYRRNVSHYIVPSAFTGAWLSSNLSVAPGDLTVIPTQVRVPAEAATPAVGRYAAFAGRFVPEKGIAVLLDAAAACSVPLELSRNRASFVNVDVPAAVPVVVTDTRQELEAFYRGARMVVVPSVWFETFGLVAAEAMALGIPVIASRIGALADLIADGVDGLLFETGNAKDLAQKMRWLWDHPAEAESMGSKARAKATQLWSPDAHYVGTMKVYEKVLNRQVSA